MRTGRVLIIEENSMVPVDRRVWYEATSLRDAGWDVIVICPEGTGAHAGKPKVGDTSHITQEVLDGVTVYRFPLVFAEHGVADYLREYVTAYISITRLAWHVWRNGPFDILHICNPPDIFFPLGLFYRILGARFIFDHHDLFPEMVGSRYQSQAGKFLYAIARISEYFTLRSADVVIATNESYRRIALDRGCVPAEKVIVVRNGPKTEEFTPEEPLAALKRGFPFLVCYVGVMGQQDGISELVETIDFVVHSLGRDDILFVLVGDGADHTMAKTRLKERGLGRFVDMPGMIRNTGDLRRYMSSADVFVSPEPRSPLNIHSTFIKIGEYMAMGKPIVAYDLPETRYTAEEAAFYVEHGDTAGFGKAITALLDDPERRQRMGAIGRKRVVDKLSWEHQQQHLFRAYEIALSARREVSKHNSTE